MTTKYLCVLVLALPFGSPVLASNQLANALDLEGSPLTAAQLAQVYAADLGDADMLERQIVLGEPATGDTIANTQGRRQVATLYDADPAETTLAELAALALDDDMPQSSDSFGTSPGKAQLALSLGVDAQAYSLPELVEMKFDAE